MIADMNDERAPQVPRSYFRFLGRKGGSAKTPAKVAAGRKNIAKARKARLDRLNQNPNPKAP